MGKFITTFLLGGLIASIHAASTINPANKYGYGANLAWMDWRGDTAGGVVIGEYVCSGYLWAANVGWIHLGSNAPANGIQYQNNSATDYGVNHDGLGNLRGCAYGANIGWINFENHGAPKLDLKTGRLSGSVYSANCGWISLSNAFAFVQTDTIQTGADTDGDGIADAWERLHFGNLTTANAVSDLDGDGMSDRGEYLADTNPDDLSDYLKITAFSALSGGSITSLTWKSSLSRCYYIQKRPELIVGTPWVDSGLGLTSPEGITTTRSIFDLSAPMRFYRVQAVKPLTP